MYKRFILNSIFDFSSAKIYVRFLMSRCPHLISFKFVTVNIFLDNVDNFKVKNCSGNKARNAPVFDTREEYWRIELEKLN